MSSLDELLGRKKKKKTTKKSQSKEALSSTVKNSENPDENPSMVDNHLKVPTLNYEPRRRNVEKSLVADKWKSEPVLCEPKEETPKLHRH